MYFGNPLVISPTGASGNVFYSTSSQWVLLLRQQNVLNLILIGLGLRSPHCGWWSERQLPPAGPRPVEY